MMPTVLEFQPEILENLQSKQTIGAIANNNYYDRGYLRLSQCPEKISAFNKSDWNFHIYISNGWAHDSAPGNYEQVQNKQLSRDPDQYFDSKKILINHYTGATGVYDPVTPWMIHHRALHFLIGDRYTSWNIDLQPLFNINPLYVDYPLLGMILNTRCLRPGRYFTGREDIDAEYFASYCCHDIKLKTLQQAIDYAEYLLGQEKTVIRRIRGTNIDVKFFTESIRGGAFIKEDEVYTCLALLKEFKENEQENLQILKNYTVLRIELFLKIALMKQFLCCFKPSLMRYISNIIDNALKKWPNQYVYWERTGMSYIQFEQTYYADQIPEEHKNKFDQRLHQELGEIFEMINQIKTIKFG